MVCPFKYNNKCNYIESCRVAQLHGYTDNTTNYHRSDAYFVHSMCEGHGLSSEGWHWSTCKKIKNEVKPEEWSRYGLCSYCGGELTGVFSKKCKVCDKQQ